jgi:hypothetical protein
MLEGKEAIEEPEQRHHGIWYLPENPEHRVPGYLAIHANGKHRLYLSDRLVEHVEDHRQYRILGVVGMGQFISLDDCFAAYSDIIGVAPRQEWVAGRSVIGAHLPEDADWRFTRAVFEIPGLTKWTVWNAFTVTTNTDPENTSIGIASTRTQRPLWEIDGIRVSIGTSLATSGDGESSRQLVSRIDLVADSDTPRSLRDLTRASIYPTQVVIGLATGMYTASTKARLVVKDEERGLSETVSAYWHRHDMEEDVGHATQWGFTLKHLASLGNKSLQAWVEKLWTIQAVGDLYLALLGGGLRFGEVRFQLITQALETYHRETSPGALLSEGDWQTVLKSLQGAVGALKSQIPAAEVIANKLEGLNSKTLRSRISELARKLGSSAARVCGGKPTSFAMKVSNTRNGFTHWSPQKGEMFERDTALVYATFRLTALLEILFLLDIGFSLESQAVKEIFRRRIDWLP